MKKKPIVNEDPSINFRISLELKNRIEEVSRSRNMTTSKYLRELLTRVHEGTYCEEELERRKKESFLFSKEFLQLVIWMYSKKKDKVVRESKEQMERYITVLKKAGEHLTKELNDEFDKLLVELIQYTKKEPGQYSYYSFIDSNEGYIKFNFELFEHTFLDNVLLESVLVNGFQEEY